jgi:hypothetical protein
MSDVVRDIITRIQRMLITELAGFRCRCGRAKKDRQTFCRACYFKLPPENRRALYHKVGKGYEVAYVRSCRYLAATGVAMEVPEWADTIDPSTISPDDPAHEADMKRRGYE